MKSLMSKLIVLALLLFVSAPAFASSSYDVTIDTSALNGESGFLYFQYVPLSAVDSAATISNFTGGALAASASSNVVDGSAVTGSLTTSPFIVVFANTDGINDYNHGITFGDSFSFHLELSIPATGGVSWGSSTFSLGLFADEAGLIPLVNVNDSSIPGTLFTVTLMNDGSSTLQTLDKSVAAVPIPGAVWLMGSALAGLFGVRRRANG